MAGNQIVLESREVFAYCASVKTMLDIDPVTLRKAAKATGIREKTALVRLGLEALIAHASARRLAALGGSEPLLRPVRRRF